MANSEENTLPNLQTILDAVNSLRQEVNEQFRSVEQRLTNLENDVRQVKELQFIFENEFDRLTALAHKSLELSHENRADVRIMRKEIEAWSEDVKNLAKQIA